jgi:DNA-binding transcriptional MerR regulator
MLRIGQLAARTGCGVETIRYYERAGVIGKPARTAAGYRAFRPEDVEQLRFVRQCRALGMSLAEVRQILAARRAGSGSCENVNAVLDRHLADVARQLRALRALKSELERLRAACRNGRDVARCGILRSLGKAARSAGGRGRG